MKKPRPHLEIGRPAPPLALPSVQGRKFTLEIYRNISPVVLWFSRGFSCPFCRQHMARLQVDYPKFRDHGVEILQIAPNPLPRAKTFFMNHELAFPYLCDETLDSYADYGVADHGFPEATLLDMISGVRGMLTQPLGYLEMLKADMWGADLLDRLRYHLTVAIEQGVFVIDAKGVIRFSLNLGPIGKIPSSAELLSEIESAKI
jgi:peroxiredoxin